MKLLEIDYGPLHYEVYDMATGNRLDDGRIDADPAAFNPGLFLVAKAREIGATHVASIQDGYVRGAFPDDFAYAVPLNEFISDHLVPGLMRRVMVGVSLAAKSGKLGSDPDDIHNILRMGLMQVMHSVEQLLRSVDAQDNGRAWAALCDAERNVKQELGE